MKLRSKAPIRRNWKGTGHLTTDPSVAVDHSPILVLEGPDGGPIEPAEAYTYGYEVVEATPEELDQLRDAGYYIPYIGK
jgi:hypothetical protein